MPTGGIRAQRQGSGNKDGVLQRLPNPPSLIEYKNLRFLIFDAPSDRTVDLYANELKKHGVKEVVRVCEPTYDKKNLVAQGIEVHDWPFVDGDPPPAAVVNDFLDLVSQRFGTIEKKDKKDAKKASTDLEPTPPPVGVHCVAGLGRAPILVTLALIEAGLSPLDAVIYVRERRRGAINARQLKYVESYKRRGKDKGCIVM
ncbi:protein-tyrosine phosphatase-like protein [Gaertneriomyces semiglobifer]|nr:protein-tyrosine phosphatase-like protein [Gaertneriomyces semiglobifer]